MNLFCSRYTVLVIVCYKFVNLMFVRWSDRNVRQACQSYHQSTRSIVVKIMKKEDNLSASLQLLQLAPKLMVSDNEYATYEKTTAEGLSCAWRMKGSTTG